MDPRYEQRFVVVARNETNNNDDDNNDYDNDNREYIFHCLFTGVRVW